MCYIVILFSSSYKFVVVLGWGERGGVKHLLARDPTSVPAACGHAECPETEAAHFPLPTVDAPPAALPPLSFSHALH